MPPDQVVCLRDQRDGERIVRSVIAYLEWRAGTSWRNLGDRSQRDDPERWIYLDSIKLIERVRLREASLPSQRIGLVPEMSARKQSECPKLVKLASQGRKRLVDRLLSIDPKLTNRNLLLRLQPLKLAKMLTQRMSVRPAETVATA